MTAVSLPRGPLVMGIEGQELGAADRERLLHPLVGGVILFARNYADPAQLRALTQELHSLRSPALWFRTPRTNSRRPSGARPSPGRSPLAIPASPAS